MADHRSTGEAARVASPPVLVAVGAVSPRSAVATARP